MGSFGGRGGCGAFTCRLSWQTAQGGSRGAGERAEKGSLSAACSLPTPPYKKSTPESPKVGVPPPCVVPVAVCEEYG